MTDRGIVPGRGPSDRAPGTYRLREGVTLVGDVLVSRRPLSATRLNDTAVDVVGALDTDEFRSPAAVAGDEHSSDPESVADLCEALHSRGFLEWRPARDSSHRPPVSVVVTVRNDRETLLTCLDALARLSYPAYEVVVVDDGSTDGTGEAASGHWLAGEGCLRVVRVGSASDPLGIGASRNLGVEAANHDIVAFTDADCRPRTDWLDALVPCLSDHDLVGGRVRPAGDTVASAYEAHNASLDMGPYASRVEPGGDTPYLPTANLVGRRTLFEAVPFPERDVAEDVGLCWRALDAGFDAVYTPAGVVEHAYRTDIRSFARRRSDYGASEALLAREHGRGDAGTVGLPAVAVAVLVLTVLGVAASGTTAVAAFGVAGSLAGVAAIAHGRQLRRRHRIPGVTGGDVARSWVRERVSAVYAVTREIARYYAGPIALAGVFLAVTGVLLTAPGVGLAGTVLLAGVVAAMAFPLIVEYRVYDPDMDIPLVGYAAYYLADHLGYQHGVYRGALAYGTVTHLRPDARFRLVGPGGE